MVNLLANIYQVIQLESCFWPTVEFKFVLTLFLLCFWSPPIPIKNFYCDAKCLTMFTVCQPFGAEQEVYSGLLEPFHQKQLPAVAENNTMGSVTGN